MKANGRGCHKDCVIDEEDISISDIDDDNSTFSDILLSDLADLVPNSTLKLLEKRGITTLEQLFVSYENRDFDILFSESRRLEINGLVNVLSCKFKRRDPKIDFNNSSVEYIIGKLVFPPTVARQALLYGKVTIGELIEQAKLPFDKQVWSFPMNGVSDFSKRLCVNKLLIVADYYDKKANNDKSTVSHIDSLQAQLLELNRQSAILDNKIKTVTDEIRVGNCTERGLTHASKIYDEVRVTIPVFPGTNCEYDSKRAFEKAGATVEIVLIRNKTAQDIEKSFDELYAAIRSSQIVMFPGGFCAGDEPEGSGKFIATVLRNAKLKAAIDDLLDNREGLMIGICNGFQALIKLGLLPDGHIKDMSDDDATLTFNTIGRHLSQMVDTRIASVKSPWLANVNVGDIHTIPISHGEGRFVAPKHVLDELFDNGQVITQYVNPNGEVTMESPYNPNGSMMAIEGIVSKDGRVLGKMAHSERQGDNRFKNIYGEMDQLIFEAGVKYFK